MLERIHRAASLASLCLVLLSGAAFGADPKRHTVEVDDHPFAVWGKSAEGATEAILLVHGRTWSALPDFDLQLEGEKLSLMDGLVESGYAVYAIDMRGYGETPRDETGWLTPSRAAEDVAGVLRWVASQGSWRQAPHLFGWSMGSTISQLVAQANPDALSSLTLFGYPHDLDVEYPPDVGDAEPAREENTAKAAASDFITPGSISEAAIDAYVTAALEADPIRVDLRGYSDYNALDPSKVTVPTLVIVGVYDPIAPAEYQAKLYMGLGTAHKQWVTVPGGDHAAFLEAPRDYFLHALTAFLEGVGQ